MNIYYEAREIVNGDKAKNGMTIARYADLFERIIKEAQVKQSDKKEVKEEAQKIEPVDKPPEVPTQQTGIENEKLVEPGERETKEYQTPEPYNFISKLKKDLSYLTGGNLTMQLFMDNAEKAFALPISQKLWIIITVTLILFSLTWIVVRIIHYRTEEKRKQQTFHKVLEINSNKDTYDVKLKNTTGNLSILQ